jgi:thiol-disulfide isomerase/thioredoxin
MTIEGHIPGAENFHLRYTYADDFISGKKVVLFDTKVDSNGYFSVTLKNKKNINGELELPYYSSPFYLEAGKDYFLEFDSVKIHGTVRPFYQKAFLNYHIKNPKNYLQDNIRHLNSIYNTYISDHFSHIFNQRKAYLIDTLEARLQNVVAGNPTLFIEQWIAYKIADLKLKLYSTKRNREAIFNHYINEQDILYHSESYMTFINGFFDKYFIHNKHFSISDLSYCINYLSDNKALQDSIGKDPLLVNERIRELASLINLKSFYFDKHFNKKGVLKVIREILHSSKFAEHQKIAQNLLYTLPYLESGTPAPEISVRSLKADRDSLRLAQLIGKYTYIVFFNSHNANCIKQMSIMDSLYTSLNNKYHFIGISLDEDLSTTRKLVSMKHYAFPIYWNGWNWRLIDLYKLKTYPTFLSIDPEGKIVRYPEYEITEIKFAE